MKRTLQRVTCALAAVALVLGCAPGPQAVVRPAPALPPALESAPSSSAAAVTSAAPAAWTEPLPDEATERPEAKRAPKSWDPESADADLFEAASAPSPAQVLPQQGLPEQQPDDGVVTSAPGAPEVVAENPPRSNDMGGLLGTPRGPVLVVHFIDVGQGDGMLIQTPGGKNILVDSGPPFGAPRLVRYLSDLEVHRIDLMVNSHAHADHIGGVMAVLREFKVAQVLDSGRPSSSPDFEKMLAEMEAQKIPMKIARRGRDIQLDDGVLLQVLAPEDPFIQGSRSDTNANSLVFRLVYKGVSFLFVGDAEEETEHRLLRSEFSRLKSTVLKVAHHGSAYASSSEFLSAVRPKLAFVSYGKNNVYGHPAPPTMDRLRREGVHTLGTGEHGNMIVVTDGAVMQVWTVPRYGGPYGGGTLWYPGRPERPAMALARGGEGAEAIANAPPPLVDLNHATLDELTKLPGVGQKMAEKMLAHRRMNGRFQSVDELLKVKGVGAKRIEKLRPLVTCGPGVSR